MMTGRFEFLLRKKLEKYWHRKFLFRNLTVIKSEREREREREREKRKENSGETTREESQQQQQQQQRKEKDGKEQIMREERQGKNPFRLVPQQCIIEKCVVK